MNKKGFTLVELLAVITVICVIGLVSFPALTQTIKSSQDDTYNSKVNDIILAAKSYNGVNNNEALMIPISTLKDNGYITGKTIDPRDSSEMNGCVHINGAGDYTYTSESCDYCDKTNIYCRILSSFPELEVGDNGCKNPDDTKNYSYMGGCYLKGAQTKNYLWYSGFVWRIMGINKDKTIKLIMGETVTVIPYNTSGNSNFDGSYIDSWLNDYFYSRLKGNNIIVANDFCQGAILTSTPFRTDCTGGITLSRNVGLISKDESDLASTSSSSYLNISQYSWTMSPYSTSIAWTSYYAANVVYSAVDNAVGVRPVINVNSTASITSGDGTISSTWSSTSSPYILNDDKTKDVTGNIVDKVTSGEYVKLADKTYRVVNKETNGVKLILDGYYQSSDGSTVLPIFGTNNTFSTTSGIGQNLNTTILEWLIPSTDTTNRSKLVTNYSWYQNDFTYGDKYTVSLNETSPTRTIQATVGLIRIGEMLSGQSYTVLTKNGTTTSSNNNTWYYWALDSFTGSTSNAWHIDGFSTLSYCSVGVSIAVRPVIVVNNSTEIISGTGTQSSPYQI